MHDQGMKKPLLVVANWKMQLTHIESTAFIMRYIPVYEDLLSQSMITLVICPSFTVLSLVLSLGTKLVRWGAQNCSSQARGAYTGDISVLTLQELSITYSIIGHSEQRRYHCETDESVARTAELLIAHSLIPIICVGETEQERVDMRTLDVLAIQLKAIKELAVKYPDASVVIAYEPLWAIGAGRAPSVDELFQIYSFIREYLATAGRSVAILYGGSVSLATHDLFKEVPLDGYLLGKQGIDGETLKKIILLW